MIHLIDVMDLDFFIIMVISLITKIMVQTIHTSAPPPDSSLQPASFANSP